MKKVQKMAMGGIPDLSGMIGKMVGDGGQSAILPVKPIGGGGSAVGGSGGSAMDGLGTVNQGASAIGNALKNASAAIGGGGGGSIGDKPEYMYKKGGKVTTTRRISTGQRSKKSSNW